jgi:hypothetical protein
MKKAGFLILFLFGCGGSGSQEGQQVAPGRQAAGGKSSCVSGFTACGGSVVGTWEIQSACSDPSSTSKCQAPVNAAYNPGYSITFNADGSYHIDSANMLITTTIPASCYPGPSAASDCAAQSSECNTGIVSNCCSLSIDGSCACSVTVKGGTGSSDGSYTLSGTNLALTANGGSPSTIAYCVRGNTMTQASTGSETSEIAVYVRR